MSARSISQASSSRSRKSNHKHLIQIKGAFGAFLGGSVKQFLRVLYFDYGNGSAEFPEVREVALAAKDISSIAEVSGDEDDPSIVEVAMKNGKVFDVLAELDDFFD